MNNGIETQFRETENNFSSLKNDSRFEVLKREIITKFRDAKNIKITEDLGLTKVIFEHEGNKKVIYICNVDIMQKADYIGSNNELVTGLAKYIGRILPMLSSNDILLIPKSVYEQTLETIEILVDQNIFTRFNRPILVPIDITEADGFITEAAIRELKENKNQQLLEILQHTHKVATYMNTEEIEEFVTIANNKKSETITPIELIGGNSKNEKKASDKSYALTNIKQHGGKTLLSYSAKTQEGIIQNYQKLSEETKETVAFLKEAFGCSMCGNEFIENMEHLLQSLGSRKDILKNGIILEQVLHVINIRSAAIIQIRKDLKPLITSITKEHVVNGEHKGNSYPPEQWETVLNNSLYAYAVSLLEDDITRLVGADCMEEYFTDPNPRWTGGFDGQIIAADKLDIWPGDLHAAWFTDNNLRVPKNLSSNEFVRVLKKYNFYLQKSIDPEGKTSFTNGIIPRNLATSNVEKIAVFGAINIDIQSAVKEIMSEYNLQKKDITQNHIAKYNSKKIEEFWNEVQKAFDKEFQLT